MLRHKYYFSDTRYNHLRGRRTTRSGLPSAASQTHIGKLYTELEKKWANKRISLCDHEIPMGMDSSNFARGDSDKFWNWGNGGKTTDLWVATGKHRIQQQFLAFGGCKKLSKRFTVYGVIGSGSFGIVFAAREKTTGRHFAIKVIEAVNRETNIAPSWTERSSWMMQFPELIDLAFNRWTACEVHVGLLVLDEPEFSQIDSVYLHPPLLSIVMDQFALINRPEMETLPNLTLADFMHETNAWSLDKIFKSVTGEDCMGGDNKSTMLNETKVCKVSFDLMRALLALLDRNMTHLDWSARNYLVDENCHAKTIDLDQIGLAADVSKDYVQKSLTAIVSWEVFALPEVAVHLTYYPNIGFFTTTDKAINKVRVRHDSRQTQLEHLGCAAFEMLHGFAPWEDSEQLVDDPTTQDIGRATKVSCWPEMDASGAEFNEERKRRRERIINDDLQIMDVQQLNQDFNPEREYNQVGQDCVDVLRSMLSKEVEDRPTILELCSFPWFQGWWAEKNPDELLRGIPVGFGPTTNALHAQVGQVPAAQGGPVAPVAQGRPPAQGEPPAQGITKKKTGRKGKGKEKDPALSSKTASYCPELKNTLYLLNLPPFPAIVSDATAEAQLKSWKDYLSQLALVLLDSGTLPAADLKRLLTLDRGAIPPPRTLAQARKLALDHVDEKIDEKLSDTYRFFCLLALSYYSTRNVCFSQMPGKHHNPFAHKSPEEQRMGRGALLQFLSGPSFVLPIPPAEKTRNIREQLRGYLEFLERHSNREARSLESEGPTRTLLPLPGALKFGQKRKIREALCEESVVAKRRRLTSSR